MPIKGIILLALIAALLAVCYAARIYDHYVQYKNELNRDNDPDENNENKGE